MNPFAYRTTGLAIKTLSGLSKAKIHTHGEENIPYGSLIFVINHFTRIETLLMPYLIFRITRTPVWSLAHASLFGSALGGFLDSVGAVSTQNPDRDRLIVKTLLTGEASWVIYPEGRMVKHMKVFEKGRFLISGPEGKYRPHTGPATLALRTEFYRRRLLGLADNAPREVSRLLEKFQIDQIDQVSPQITYIVPVNITYYPLRVHQNVLSYLARRMVENLSERVMEEIMTEGTMLLSGVDVDVRFGRPLDAKAAMESVFDDRDLRNARPFDFENRPDCRRRMKKEALTLMQRYMAAIYALTTVNYDHLFAALLRRTPFRTLPVQSLRRRVFLIAFERLKNLGVYCHEALSQDPIGLLTDDAHQWSEDFMRVALNKGVLRRDGDHLDIVKSKIAAESDLHRARIDNPIAVIANAIEPLVALQQHIRRFAWQPEFLVRRRIVRHLLNGAQKEFEADYREHFVPGETKPPEVGRPFVVRAKSRKLGVLLIHGYMAAPMEVRALAEHIGRRGIRVYAPRLKGHGTSPEDLAACAYQDWVRSAEAGYAIMATMCARVVVGGFSTGAGLALELASRIKRIAGVFAVSAPMRLQDLGARFASAVTVWNRIMERVRRNGAKMEFVENKPENPHINYLRNPVSGVAEIDRLMDTIESRLPTLSMPALVIQSERDPVVDPKGSEKIFKLIGSEDKTYIRYNFERHGILNGQGAERVHRVVGDFVENVRDSVR
jgi:esterase/lipase/1-acyl-sn-glycerol-3-phosphate acyltransferase